MLRSLFSLILKIASTEQHFVHNLLKMRLLSCYPVEIILAMKTKQFLLNGIDHSYALNIVHSRVNYVSRKKEKEKKKSESVHKELTVKNEWLTFVSG